MTPIAPIAGSAVHPHASHDRAKLEAAKSRVGDRCLGGGGGADG